jgi:flagellar hook-associated protein 3 FlgL
MRISNGMMNTSHLNSIQNNLQKMDKENQRIVTGRKVNRLSDDPFNTAKILNMRNEVKSVEQYEKNCNEGIEWMDQTDNALDQLGKITSDIKKLLIESGNGIHTDEDLDKIKNNIDSLMKQMVDTLNTSHGGNYIFSGTDTDEAPVTYEIDALTGAITIKVSDNLDPDKMDNNLHLDLGSGVKGNYNTTLKDIFGSDDPFKDLNDLSQELAVRDDSDKNLSTVFLDKMEKIISDISGARAQNGAKTKQFEALKDKNGDDLVVIKEALSKKQDADYATTLTKLKEAEFVYTATLKTTSQFLNNTILDYI